jgi:hypothetical protein
MDRYFFDVDDGSRFFADPDGSEYPCIEMARQHTLELLAETASDVVPKSLSDDLCVSVTLRDAGERELITAVLRLEVGLKSPSGPAEHIAQRSLQSRPMSYGLLARPEQPFASGAVVARQA